jgi:hypothetical protein
MGMIRETPFDGFDVYKKGGFVWSRSPTSTTIDKDRTMVSFGVGASGAAGTFIELRA